MRSKYLNAASLLMLLLPSNVLANSSNGQFNVTVTITKQCTITAPASISLGSYGAADLLSSSANGSQNYTVNCTKSTPYTIGFSSANDLSGSSVHQMKGTGQNADVIQYNLFDQTTNSTTPLDASTHVISDVGTGALQTKSIKAQIVNYTTSVTPDVYTDTVTMTVTY